jgi:hypothetical protein
MFLTAHPAPIEKLGRHFRTVTVMVIDRIIG